MKYLLLITTALSLTFYGISQEKLEAVPFVAYWSIGDAFKYEVVKTSIKVSDGIVTENDTTKYIAVFNVIDSTATSYTVKYSMKNDLTSIVGNTENSESLKQYENLDVIIKTDELGTFLEIENWKEISDQMIQMTSKMIDGFIKAGVIDKSERNERLSALTATMSSKQAIEQLLFQELQLMLFPFGVELSTSILKYEELLPNMLGGDPLRANSTLGLTEINEEDNTCVLSHTLSLNKKDTKTFVGDVLESMKLQSSELDKALTKSKYEINDLTISSFDYDYGIPLSVSYTRNTEIQIHKESMTQVKEIKIELLEIL